MWPLRQTSVLEPRHPAKGLSIYTARLSFIDGTAESVGQLADNHATGYSALVELVLIIIMSVVSDNHFKAYGTDAGFHRRHVFSLASLVQCHN